MKTLSNGMQCEILKVFKYPLFTLGTTSQKPFIYNSLN